MKVIAVIQDTDEIKEILAHLVKIGRTPPGFDPRYGYRDLLCPVDGFGVQLSQYYSETSSPQSFATVDGLRTTYARRRPRPCGF